MNGFLKIIESAMRDRSCTAQEAASSLDPTMDVRMDASVQDTVLMWTPDHYQGNGIVVDNRSGKLLCWGNDAPEKVPWGDPRVDAALSLEHAKVCETNDGTILRVWHHGGRWYLSTRRKIDASQAYWTASRNGAKQSFAELFEEADGWGTLGDLNPEYTYTVVLVHPRNRNVLRYKKARVLPISHRHLETGKETQMEPGADPQRVRSEFDPTRARGFIVHAPQSRSLQVDHPDFEKAESLRQKGRTLDRAFVTVCMREPASVPEFLKCFPSDRMYLDSLLHAYTGLRSQLAWLAKSDGVKKEPPEDHVLHSAWLAPNDPETVYRTIRKLIG